MGSKSETNDYVPDLIFDLDVIVIGHIKCRNITNLFNPSHRLTCIPTPTSQFAVWNF